MRPVPTYKELEERVRTLERALVDHQNCTSSDGLKEHYLETILNNTNIPVYLKDVDYKYIFIDRQFGILANVTDDQIKGKTDFDIFSETVARLFRSQDEEVVKRRELVEFEETILLPLGVQSFITAKFPLFDSEGNVSGVGGACTDITAYKKTEAELKEAEEKYRGIFEHSPLGILQIDKNGIITASNEKLAEILGSNVDKLIGFDLLQSVKDQNVRKATLSALSGKLVHFEGPYVSVTGSESVYLRGVFSPLASSDGSIVAAIGIVEDITSRKDAEEALKKAHEELEHRVADRTAQLDRKTERLLETNVALKILLEKREEDRKELETSVMLNVEKLIYPYLEKLKIKQSDATIKALLNIIQANLEEITSSFANNHKSYLLNLTPAQIQTAELIKQGHTTKEIAALLNLSPSTIACHRQEIRKRLSLTNRKTNLQTALTGKT
jgi:PAS domain S-box-containing protein